MEVRAFTSADRSNGAPNVAEILVEDCRMEVGRAGESVNMESCVIRAKWGRVIGDAPECSVAVPEH